jgi:hypothetical protein
LKNIHLIGKCILLENMGRKKLPKGERREVISISLKPATIEAIERMRGDKTRSTWVEEMVEHILPIHLGVNELETVIECQRCNKAWVVNDKLERSMFNQGHYYDCPNMLKVECPEKLTVEERVIE